MRFVALDLETTGLSPETDTIIEVAAVAFELEQDESGIWQTTNVTEHSQLVYPEREMTEEISMITGITDTMLRGKPAWGDIRERVREFIGIDSVIVGHNVLFDVSMLRTHDIDLSLYPILDTFELSEIFSQDIESLNLGYLAGQYGLSAGDKEHRALGDTRLSVGLFVHYLNLARTLPESKKTILMLAGEREEKKNIGLLGEILGWEQDDSIPHPYPPTPLGRGARDQETRTKKHVPRNTYQETRTSYTLTSLPLGREHEGKFLRENIHRGGHSSIGVFGYMQTSYMKTLLEDLGYRSEIYHAPEEYCSIDELHERVVRGNWKRKESILITKLLYWLEDTPTGLIKELKLYGEEREEIAFFRMQQGETNPYYTRFQESLDNTDVVIYDMTKHIQDIKDNPQIHKSTNPQIFFLKDIPLLEEAMRRSLSIHISIEKLVKSLGEFDRTERLVEMIRFIEAMYLDFPARPTGPEVSPPGGYGETYFVTQFDIWHRGCVQLSLVSNCLLREYSEWKTKRVIETRRGQYLAKIIEASIEGLLRFHRIQDSTGAIIEIQHNCLSITLIPRDVQSEIRSFISGHGSATLYSCGMCGAKITQFLKNETGLENPIQKSGGNQEKQHLVVDARAIEKLAKSGDLGGTVILTTSAKHIREIGKSLEKTGLKILMQGISGGKGKQLGLFKNNPTGTILVGTIDMWREELELWNHTRHIILAKLPFDPPTDAYFLARTVGMKNNFELYSEPMLIIKVNTLLTRIYSSTYNGVVYCEDVRLTETIWGKEMLQEIV